MSYSKSIRSQRIATRSGLGRVSAHTVRGGMGGAESCGPNQQWDPNYVFNGIKGQCTPKGTPLVRIVGGGTPGFWDSFSAGLKVLKPPAGAPPQSGGGSGMSRNTMIAIGLGAVGIISIAMIARK